MQLLAGRMRSTPEARLAQYPEDLICQSKLLPFPSSKIENPCAPAPYVWFIWSEMQACRCAMLSRQKALAELMKLAKYVRQSKVIGPPVSFPKPSPEGELAQNDFSWRDFLFQMRKDEVWATRRQTSVAIKYLFDIQQILTFQQQFYHLNIQFLLQTEWNIILFEPFII